MKKILIVLLILAGKINAQTFQVTGQVNVPFATVSIFRGIDSLIIKTVVADTGGNFKLDGLVTGKYYLLYGGIGFQTLKSPTYLLISGVKLPKTTLLPITTTLADVTIVGEKHLIEVLPNKTVLNVQTSLTATGLSAFDVLRKAPGIIVDNRNSLILEGKTGVSIFIDGKRSLLSGDDLTNYLKTMQSSEIATLEIITQPSSKYDAAGNAGIINITLIKNKSFGTNGSLLLGYAVGRYSKYNSAFSINKRSKKLNFFGSYSNSFNTNRSYLNLDRFQNGYEYDNRSYDKIKDRNHNFRTGLDCNIDKNSTLGLVINGVFRGYDNREHSRTPIKLNDEIQQILIANGMTNMSSKNLSTNINYHYQDPKGYELSLDGDYGYFKSNRNQVQYNVYDNNITGPLQQAQTNYQMLSPVNIHLFAAKADFNHSIGKIKLASGLKSSRVKTDNKFDFSAEGTYRPDRSNVFSYAENIQAAYFNLSQSWSKVSITVGLRAEQTLSFGELSSIQENQHNSVKRSYTDLFPSSGITYKVNAKDNLSLTYSRRVDRPDYRSLNPFEYNIDELSFSKGNPFLKPQYTHAIKLSNTYNYTFTTSLSYSFINDFFAQITDTIGNNRNFISPQNMANQQVINIGISYPMNITKWWSLYTSLNAFRSIYKSESTKFIPLTRNTFGFYASNSFILTKNYTAEISGWFSSPSVWSGSYKTNSMGSLDLGMQKTFAQNRISLGLAVSDLLYTSNWSGTSQYGALQIKGSGGYESRQFRVNLKYNFGRKEIKAPSGRPAGAEEEKSRIKI